MESKIFSVCEQLMLGPGEDLFDHIASCLAEFVIEHGLEETNLPLGFTFSFPVIQEGLAKGKFIERIN